LATGGMICGVSTSIDCCVLIVSFVVSNAYGSQGLSSFYEDPRQVK
jgi:hypothetical protein